MLHEISRLEMFKYSFISLYLYSYTFWLRQDKLYIMKRSGMDLSEITSISISRISAWISVSDCCTDIFRTPELKAGVRFSDRRLSVIRSHARLSVNFSQFYLLQNHWANFNQSWRKASLGEWDLRFFFSYEGPEPFSGEIITK